MIYKQDHNHTMPAPVPPVIFAGWSRERCWHGQTVRIHVRCGFVPDGTLVDLAIQPQGGVAIDTIQNLAVNGGVLDHNYVVNWQAIVVPAGSTAFEVIATVQGFNVASPPSIPMYVDLMPPQFSA